MLTHVQNTVKDNIYAVLYVHFDNDNDLGLVIIKETIRVDVFTFSMIK